MQVLTPRATILFLTLIGGTRPPGRRKPGADLCLPVFCYLPVFSFYPAFLPLLIIHRQKKACSQKIAVDLNPHLPLLPLRSTGLRATVKSWYFSPSRGFGPFHHPFAGVFSCQPRQASKEHTVLYPSNEPTFRRVVDGLAPLLDLLSATGHRETSSFLGGVR